jgi:hypothetical protein
MKEAAVVSGDYQRLYGITERVLDKYFELHYTNATDGIVMTRFSQTKSPNEGIVKVAAIAMVSQGEGKPSVHLKVIKQRMVEAWDVWEHNIIEREEFLGSDTDLEQHLLKEISLLAAKTLPAAGAKPKAPPAPPKPPEAQPETKKEAPAAPSPPVTLPKTSAPPEKPKPSAESLGAAPAGQIAPAPGKKPESSEKKPESSEKKPESSEKKPESSEKKPESSEKKPNP